MRSLCVLVALTSCVALGCGESQLEGKPKAVVEESPGDNAEPKDKVVASNTETPPSKEVGGTHKAPKVSDRAPKEAEVSSSAEKPKLPPLSKRPDPLEGAERELVLDARRSTVAFVGSKISAEHEGSFAVFSGQARLQGYEFKELKLNVQMNSVSSDHPKLTNHLKSPDFFNAAKYPTSRFVTTKVRPGGEGVATHTITGELSMLAVTKRITFPATIVVTDAGATGIAEFKINRKDFGIVYPGRADDLIADDVLLKLNLAYLDKRYAK